MEPAPPDYMPALPDDVLIVEDDPIIAIDFEDAILGFGVKTIRTAGGVATGYGADVRLPAAFANKPRLPKPYSADALQAMLRSRSDGGAEP
jgi:hypothetical protein